MCRVPCEKVFVCQLLGSYGSLRLLVARIVVKVLVKDGMLLLDLGWADTAQVLRCLLARIGIVVGEVSVQPGRVEVVDDVPTNAGIVVIRHGRDIRRRALGNERFVG